MKTARPYVQRARAESAAATRLAILESHLSLVVERADVAVPLGDIADRAGVTVQTILRRFGNRERLFEETLDHGQAVFVEERSAPPGNVDAAITSICGHYEQRGRAVLALLANEHAHPRISAIVERGRTTHRDWVAEVFGPLLPSAPADSEELQRLLVVATDVYAWKLLRLDMGLSRSATERHLRRLVRALIPPPRSD